MTRIVLLVMIVLGCGASATVGQEASFNFDRDADFAKFKSYKWIAIRSAQQVDEITARQITFVIDAELSKKGLLKTDSENADLYIGYQAALSRQTRWSAYRTDWGYGPRWDTGTSTTTQETLDAGQLDLDMYAPGQRRLVWRGAVTKAIDIKVNPDKSEKKLQKCAEKLLENYPPKRQ